MKQVKLCQIDGCMNPYYAKGFCKSHYKKNEWKINDKIRERIKAKNRKRWKKNYKSKYKKRHNEYYHTVTKNDPRAIKRKNQKSSEWASNHKLQMNESRRKRRKEHPESVIQENRNFTNKIIESMEKFSWSRKHINFTLYHWSKTVRKRDDEKCQVCGSSENLVSHHIFEKSKHPKLCFNMNNGITLCRNCHLETHGLKNS